MKGCGPLIISRQIRTCGIHEVTDLHAIVMTLLFKYRGSSKSGAPLEAHVLLYECMHSVADAHASQLVPIDCMHTRSLWMRTVYSHVYKVYKAPLTVRSLLN